MKKLVFAMVLALLVSLMMVPAYAAPGEDGASVSRDEEIRTELPDPNDPTSPDYVIVDEDGVPTGYIKAEDPNNPGQYVYVPEEGLDDPNVPLGEDPGEGLDDPEVPLGEDPGENLDDPEVPLGEDPGDPAAGDSDDTTPAPVLSPQTGEDSMDAVLVAAVVLCMAGMAVVAVSKKNTAA